MNDTETNIIKAHGKNTASFFQNIITNDIKSLNKNNPIYTAMLSPQGKYLHDFIILQEENYFLIENNKSTTKTLIEDIKKYDLRNEIIIEVLDNLVSRVIIEDKLSDMLLDKIKEKKIYRDDQFKFFKDPRSEKFLFRFWIEKNFTSSHNYHFSNKTEVEYKRILMKIPNSEKDLIYNKSFILNYNFENINALSFEKGCYIGQENTARQKYRGSQKYSLQIIKIIRGTIPQLNEDIFLKKSKLGTIKSSSNDIFLFLMRNDEVKKKLTEITTDSNFTFKIL